MGKVVKLTDRDVRPYLNLLNNACNYTWLLRLKIMTASSKSVKKLKLKYNITIENYNGITSWINVVFGLYVF